MPAVDRCAKGIVMPPKHIITRSSYRGKVPDPFKVAGTCSVSVDIDLVVDQRFYKIGKTLLSQNVE
jgi:hypothetical protein